ncbi:MAG: beta-lactamase family protein [Defluviitaleaceae bacterium]|nr:beta-lactamase family protein [Defluviitaleaceae bacterium]
MKNLKKIPWVPLIIIIVIFMLGLFMEQSTVSGQIITQEDLPQYLDTMLTSRNFRGTALLVRDGETILRAAYGMACDVQGIENTVYSRFHIASVTKNFTGAAIMLLELEGKLSPSDTLDNFFEGADGLENVTIAHLLAMQGGFYDITAWMFERPEFWEVEYALDMTIEELEAYVMENAWHGTPRSQSSYCNTDYWLLGRIIEKASGMPYEEFIASRLFKPAGMVNSGFSGIDESVAPHGIPSLYADGENLFNPNNWPFFFAYSTGGLISTIDDLNLWLDAYFSGDLFPAHLLDNIQTGVYNYGWLFESDTIWHHSGRMPGFSSHIIYDRSSSTRIILLSNNWIGAASVNNNLVRAISDVVLGVGVDGFVFPAEG